MDMKRTILWLAVAVVSLSLLAGFLMARRNPAPPPPEVSLGVMKSCAHLGALAKRVALDREQGIALDGARYGFYRRYLTSRQTLFRSPDFAVLLAYRSDRLQPEAISNLGVQTCVAAYYGFRQPLHHEALYQQALSCQAASSGEQETLLALDDCMGREYQRLLAAWWQEANDSNQSDAELLASSRPARARPEQ